MYLYVQAYLWMAMYIQPVLWLRCVDIGFSALLYMYRGTQLVLNVQVVLVLDVQVMLVLNVQVVLGFNHNTT
jgi:hypothetical protein